MPSDSDLVIVVPGLMGSRLTRHGVPVWEPSAGWLSLAIQLFGENLDHLRLPDGIGDDHPDDDVEATGLATELHGLPGVWTPARDVNGLLRCLRYLGYTPGNRNLALFPYDWRLSVRHNAWQLALFAERAMYRRVGRGVFERRDLVFVCQSLGGLVARWYVEKLGGAAATRRVVTLGTPYDGTAKAVEQLVNGVPESVGPFAAPLTELLRGMPSMYQLMTDRPCVDDAGTLRRVDEMPLPGLNPAMVADAMALYRDLAAAEAARPAGTALTHAVVGDRQPTTTALRISHGRAEPVATAPGDGTVSSAVVEVGAGLDHVYLVVDQHGSLQSNPFAHDAIEAAITGRPVRNRRGGTEPVGVTAPDFVLAGAVLPVEVRLEPGSRHAVQVTVLDDGYRVVASRRPTIRDGRAEAVFDGLEPGGYAVRVTGADPGSPVTTVTSSVLVWDPTVPSGG